MRNSSPPSPKECQAGSQTPTSSGSRDKVPWGKELSPFLFPLSSFLFFFYLLSCPKPEPNLSPNHLPKYQFAVAEALLSQSAVCPVCLRPVFNCELKRNADQEFYSALSFVLEQNGFKMLKLGLPNEPSEKKKNPEPWLLLAKQVKADYLIFPIIYCWSERRGSEISASAPAEVGFHLHIYESKSAQELWGGNFNERQEPLSENLLELKKFIHRGGKWVKAEELGKEGIEKLLKEFLKVVQENDSNSSH